MDKVTIIYDFRWSEVQGMWADLDGKPVMVEAAVRERDEGAYEYEEDEHDYRRIGEMTSNYRMGNNITYKPGDGVINDANEVIWGLAARRFIEARAALTEGAELFNMDEHYFCSGGSYVWSDGKGWHLP